MKHVLETFTVGFWRPQGPLGPARIQSTVGAEAWPGQLLGSAFLRSAGIRGLGLACHCSQAGYFAAVKTI